MLLDLRGYSEEESLKKLRDILRYSCPQDEILEVLINSERFEKKLTAFLKMSGLKFDSLRDGSTLIIRIIEKSCNCQ